MDVSREKNTRTEDKRATVRLTELWECVLLVFDALRFLPVLWKESTCNPDDEGEDNDTF